MNSTKSDANKTKAIHVLQRRGVHEVPNGHFSEIWCSRPGIAKLESPELDGSGSANLILEPSFDHNKDWVLVEANEEYTCDPGWTWHIIAGTLPRCFNRASEMAQWLTKRQAMSSSTPARLL